MGKALKDQLTGLLAMAAVLPVVIVAGARSAARPGATSASARC